MATLERAIRAASTHFLQFRIQWASIAFVYYDYMLTFPDEVQYMWKQRFRISTLLYIFCRYAMLANVLFLLGIAQMLGTSCDSVYQLVGALSVLGRTAIVVTFTARTYAVYGRSRWILASLGTIALMVIILAWWHVPGLACVGPSKNALAGAALAVVMVAFEVMSAVLSTVRCVQALRETGGIRSERNVSSFMYIILEQGIMYFVIAAGFTITSVVLNFTADNGTFQQRMPNAFYLPMTCSLTARFLLYLRSWESKNARDGAGKTIERKSMSTFQVANQAASSLISIGDFGEDALDVARRRNRQVLTQNSDLSDDVELRKRRSMPRMGTETSGTVRTLSYHDDERSRERARSHGEIEEVADETKGGVQAV